MRKVTRKITTPGRPSTPPAEARNWWIWLALAIAVLSVYLQTRTFEFLRYDDPEFVVNNIHIRGGLTPATIAWAFTTGYAANWFPLTWLSYMVGVNLYGLSSGWHHLTNVLLHAITSILLFAVLRRATGMRWPSALVAMLFAIHPLHVEAVAWVSQRREVLSGLFWLLSIWAYLNYVGRPRTSAYVLLLAAFGCGLMSKPTIVTLPFSLLLFDYWPLRRWETTTVRRLIVEKVPLVVLSGAASVVTFLVQRHGGATVSIAAVPFLPRLENAVVSYLAYAAQFLWPAKLAVLYPYATNLPAWKAIGAGIILASVTTLAIARRERQPYLFTGWFWFGGTLIPVIGLVQVGVQSRADRYMYAPLIGLALIFAWGLAELADRQAWLRRMTPAIAVAVCCVYGAVAWSTTSYWRDTVTLFRHAIEVTTDNWAALDTLSMALITTDHAEEAVPYIAETLRLRPDLPEGHINFGAVLSKRGDFDDATAQYRRALQLEPANPDAQEGLGVVLTEKGQYPEALSQLETVVKLKPEDADSHYNLGRLYGLAGRADLAAAEFAETVNLQPENAAAHFNLGVSYASLERFDRAADEFVVALRWKPDYLAARFNLGSALANLGRLDEAITQFQAILRMQPDFPAAREALENCLALKKESGH
jgi:tetratricopeptide (TPR) repeat protein